VRTVPVAIDLGERMLLLMPSLTVCWQVGLSALVFVILVLAVIFMYLVVLRSDRAMIEAQQRHDELVIAMEDQVPLRRALLRVCSNVGNLQNEEGPKRLEVRASGLANSNLMCVHFVQFAWADLSSWQVQAQDHRRLPANHNKPKLRCGGAVATLLPVLPGPLLLCEPRLPALAIARLRDGEHA
jgi:hypothetical protein